MKALTVNQLPESDMYAGQRPSWADPNDWYLEKKLFYEHAEDVYLTEGGMGKWKRSASQKWTD